MERVDTYKGRALIKDTEEWRRFHYRTNHQAGNINGQWQSWSER